MNTCKTCKHWHSERWWRGSCDYIGKHPSQENIEANTEYSAQFSAFVPFEGGEKVVFDTGPDFGCVHHACSHVGQKLEWDNDVNAVRCTSCGLYVRFDGGVKCAFHNIHMVTQLPMTDAAIVTIEPQPVPPKKTEPKQRGVLVHSNGIAEVKL